MEEKKEVEIIPQYEELIFIKLFKENKTFFFQDILNYEEITQKISAGSNLDLTEKETILAKINEKLLNADYFKINWEFNQKDVIQKVLKLQNTNIKYIIYGMNDNKLYRIFRGGVINNDENKPEINYETIRFIDTNKPRTLKITAGDIYKNILKSINTTINDNDDIGNDAADDYEVKTKEERAVFVDNGLEKAFLQLISKILQQSQQQNEKPPQQQLQTTQNNPAGLEKAFLSLLSKILQQQQDIDLKNKPQAQPAATPAITITQPAATPTTEETKQEEQLQPLPEKIGLVLENQSFDNANKPQGLMQKVIQIDNNQQISNNNWKLIKRITENQPVVIPAAATQ